MAFFAKADAKVRLIFELPKLFGSFFYFFVDSSPIIASVFQPYRIPARKQFPLKSLRYISVSKASEKRQLPTLPLNAVPSA